MRGLTLSLLIAGVMTAAYVMTASIGDARALLEMGVIPARLAGQSIEGVGVVPAWLTPLTTVFAHTSFLHLAFNALILVYCGQRVESAVGNRWLAILLVAGAYGAAIAELLWSPGALMPIVGASGATSALIAMYAMLFSEQKVASRGPIPGYVLRGLWLLAAWTGLQLLVAVASDGQIATVAHTGGFLTGLLLSRPILNRRFARNQF
jgi:membrane associated rhomboid family serine protease